MSGSPFLLESGVSFCRVCGVLDHSGTVCPSAGKTSMC